MKIWFLFDVLNKISIYIAAWSLFFVLGNSKDTFAPRGQFGHEGQTRHPRCQQNTSWNIEGGSRFHGTPSL